MATPATPSAPAAPVAAPAASPAPAAPASAPSTPAPAATPVTPASPAAPGSGAPAAAPAAAPKNTDYPNTADGQTRFLSDLKKWEKENPKPAEAGALANAAVKPEDKAAADQLGQQPGEKPAEAAAPAKTAEPATPQAIADLMQQKPEFGKLLEADPELKATIFANARELAAAKPILELFPTVGDAQFAQQNAQDMVGLKTLAMRAVDRPESIPDLLSAFDSQFAVTDNEGKPVLDAQGNPTYAPDRKVFQDALVSRELSGQVSALQPQIEQLKARLQNQVYPNEQARALDERRLEDLENAALAFRVVDYVRSGEWFQQAPPAVPEDASPEFKAWAEQERARLEQEKQAIENQKKGATAEQRAQQRTEFQGAVRSDMGSAVGSIIGNKLKEAIDSGVYIPEFYLQEKHRDAAGNETKTSAMAMRIFQQFENLLMKPGSRTLMEITQHEMLPQNEQTRAIRKDWYSRRAADLVPGLVQAEIDRIQNLVRVDQDRQKTMQAQRAGAAQAEPHSAGSGLPQGASEQQLRAQAEEMAKKDPGYAAATPSEKQARIVTQFNRLTRGPVAR